MRRTRWTVAALAVALAASWSVGVVPGGQAAETGSARPRAAGEAAGGPLARFHGQTVEWHGCQRGQEDGDGEALDRAGARCAEITVPLDYGRPDGRTTAVAIARLAATDTGRRIGPMIINLGGPASPVLAAVPLAREAMGDTGARFDLIGMDPRFTGRSAPLDCGWPAGWLPRSAGAGRKSFDRTVGLAWELARRCAVRHGDVLPYVSTANTARDMDVIRAALGDSRLSYLGYSYGSYLGAMYTQLFPSRADRIVLDSAIDAAKAGTRMLRDNGPHREAALREWAAWAARHDDEYHLGATAAAVLSTVERVYRTAARRPLRVGRYTVDDTIVPGVLAGPLTDDTEETNAELAVTVRIMARAAAGETVQPTGELDQSLAKLLTGAESRLRSAQTAIMCADGPARRDPRWYWRDIEANRAEAPIFGPLSRTITPCAFWPARAEDRIRVRNAVPALIVNADREVGAIYEGALALHRSLTGSRLITLAGVRTHGVYLFQGSACVDGAVNAYLNTGTLPAEDLTCAGAAAGRAGVAP